MGGRGSSSGKSSGAGAGGGGKDNATQSKKTVSGGGGSATQSQRRTYEKPGMPVSKMSDAQLKRELVKAAKVYYASGKSSISFGGVDTDTVAEMLAKRKMSRSMMEKQYRSILKRLK